MATLAAVEMRGRTAMTEPVQVEMKAVFPIPKSWSEAKRMDAILGRIRPTCSPDIDNIFKSVADGLNGIAYRDDSLIVSVTASKVYGQSSFVVATVKPINGSESVSEAQSQESAR